MTELTYAVQDALAEPDWDVAAERVRHAVIAEVKQLDPAVNVRYTGYFNHSFAPDFVLTWQEDREPKEVRHTRELYLRLEVAPRAFADDIRWLREGGPLFLGLRPQQEQGPFEYTLNEADPDERCLVTVTEALDEWSPEDVAPTDQTIATSALVQAGRGLVDHQTALGLRTALGEGLPALLSGSDSSKVTHVIDVLTQLLSPEEAGRIERQFWFLWLGSGGLPDALERGGFGLGSFEPDELRTLLTHLLSHDFQPHEDYWRQLGMHFSAHMLGELLETQPPSPNLDALVRANIASWTAKGAGGRQHPNVPLIHELSWHVENEMLSLNVGDLSICFTDDRRHFNNWPEDGRRPSWEELKSRLSDHNLTQVEVLTPENEVAVRRRGGVGLHAASDDLHRFGGMGGAHDAVQAITVQVPGTDANARVDFNRRVVDAGDDNVPLRTLALLAARYLSGVSEEKLDDIERFLAGRTPGQSPPVA